MEARHRNRLLGSVESGTENVASDQVTTARPNMEKRKPKSRTICPPEQPQELCKIVDDDWGISCRLQADCSRVALPGKDSKSFPDPSLKNAAQRSSELCRTLPNSAEYEY